MSVEENVIEALTLKHGYMTLIAPNYGKQCQVVNVYDGYRDDETLKELIIKIYNYSQYLVNRNFWSAKTGFCDSFVITVKRFE